MDESIATEANYSSSLDESFELLQKMQQNRIEQRDFDKFLKIMDSKCILRNLVMITKKFRA